MKTPGFRAAAGRYAAGGIAALGLVILSTYVVQAEGAADPDPLRERARSLFGIVEAAPPGDIESPAAVLGRRLFWDAGLSRDGRTSCASCHTREAWGSDARPFSVDAREELTGRNSQTVFNSMDQPAIRWLGDRTDGAHQAERSIVGSMGFHEPAEIVPLLLERGYADGFASAFPGEAEPVTPRNYGRALEAYQRTLITPAPFDSFLAGDSSALTDEQRGGLELFMATGCAACHSGPLLGGSTSQRFGIVEDYWTATGSERVDEGRYRITGEEEDRYVFRVPMLRNVARTAPYFHDGSVAELRDAIRIMARVQLGRTLSDEDLELMETFLEALTGEIPTHYSPPAM
jgi:cytochrome c peroxidase